MRRPSLLLITLPLLLAGTWLIWQHRFQLDPAHPGIDLRELVSSTPLAAGSTWLSDTSGQPRLALYAGTESRPVVQRLPLPGLPPVEFLMFDFKVKALGLVPGGMPWSDGRLMLEWHPTGDRHAMQPQYLSSARHNHASVASCLVSRAKHGPSLPVLRLEHLGSAGWFRLEHCRIAVVRETAWWQYGRWLLLGGWFAWSAVLAGGGRTSGLGRPLLAAAVWLLCVTQWALPGPWESIRPLAPAFAGTPAPVPFAPAAVTMPASAPVAPPGPMPDSPAAAPPPVQSLGELPYGGSLLLEIKDRIKQARPLFHLLLFFFPALAFAVLIGRWKAMLLTALLAAMIEGSQYLFGYGFDSSDLFDLACDAIGVALAFLLHRRVARWIDLRKSSAENPREAAGASASPGQSS